MATLALLRQALDATPSTPFSVQQEWSNFIGIGEWLPKKTKNGRVEIRWYLDTVKRYRPDFKTVYGFFIENGTLWVMSHNACGTKASDAVELDHIDSWIAFVVHLYRIYDTRDARFEPLTDTDDARTRWRIRTDENSISTFRPFDAGPSPGRVTWLSFEQHDSSPQLARGFLKMSWQDTSARCNESDMLNLAHKDGWVPGLVRPRSTQRDISDFVCADDSAGPPKRVKEMIHLASIGEPLSQCRSVLHLFKVIFDAIGVHDDLLGLDILHRDMSWHNILCNPWHDPETLKIKNVKSGTPSIDFILSGKDSAPCALVLDLDHAALMKELYSKEFKVHEDKFGTPMFVATEMSCPESVRFTLPNRSLLDRLRAIDAYPELVGRAFPRGDSGFMDAFMRVFRLECERARNLAKVIRLDPREVLHRPRHDMESIFWVIFWALLRAWPISALPADEYSDHDLCAVGNGMLKHRLGFDFTRAYYMPDPPVRAFHPMLAKYGPLIEDMATYLCIPWHLYSTTVPELPPNHAHIAFRRMLLVEIYQLSDSNAADDILFDRKVPRCIPSRFPWRNKPRDYATNKPVPTELDPETDLLDSSTVTSSQSARESATEDTSQVQQVTRASDPSLGSDSVIIACSTSEPAASKRGNKRTFGSRDSEDAGSDHDTQPLNKRARVMTLETGAGPDITALIDAFWADRTLWFGGIDRSSDLE